MTGNTSGPTGPGHLFIHLREMVKTINTAESFGESVADQEYLFGFLRHLILNARGLDVSVEKRHAM